MDIPFLSQVGFLSEAQIGGYTLEAVLEVVSFISMSLLRFPSAVEEMSYCLRICSWAISTSYARSK